MKEPRPDTPCPKYTTDDPHECVSEVLYAKKPTSASHLLTVKIKLIFFGVIEG
jgi:hypothetical protein